MHEEPHFGTTGSGRAIPINETNIFRSQFQAFIQFAGNPPGRYALPDAPEHSRRPPLQILAMTQRERQPEERTLMLCDEVGNLGRIDALLTAATLMRSFGLT